MVSVEPHNDGHATERRPEGDEVQLGQTRYRFTPIAPGESKLALNWNDGRRWLAIDTGSWRITHPSTGGLPWRIPAIAVAVLVALAVALVRRRRTTHAHEEALPQPL